MWRSLSRIASEMDGSVRVYPGHDYAGGGSGYTNVAREGTFGLLKRRSLHSFNKMLGLGFLSFQEERAATLSKAFG